MATYDSPGRGRKPCPSCGKYAGVRSRICENCGSSFGSVAQDSVAVETSRTVAGKSVVRPVYEEVVTLSVAIPAGKCPFSLSNSEPETVSAWADKVSDHARQSGKRLLPSALRYYVRQFFDFHSEEYRRVAAMLPDQSDQSVVETEE